jgi:hypothetical protein
MTRFVLAITLVTTSLLTLSAFGADVPVPDRHDNPYISAPDAADKAIDSFRHAEDLSHVSQASRSELPEVAQFVVATACYTFIGRICPMEVAVPVGSPCTCYYADGAYAGIAR